MHKEAMESWKCATEEHQKMVAVLDRHAEKCIALRRDLLIAGVPESDDRWTMDVSQREYHDACDAGFPRIAGIRLVVGQKVEI